MKFGVNFDMFVDRSHVIRAINKWKRAVLSRTGAYARQAVKNAIKNPTKKDRKRQGRLPAGQPPRRGPTDLLRRFIFFGIDTDTESVVIGPLVFSSQPKLRGVKNVPELLEFGGEELIRVLTKKDDPARYEFVKYEPHPYVRPQQADAEKRMEQLIESTPLI